MNDFVERRKYKRCSSTICHANMSENGRVWRKVELQDISAGGLRFESNETYSIGQALQFDLLVYNAFSEFNLQFEGVVVHTRGNNEGKGYGVKFVNVNKYHQIQLDEIIRAKINITDPLSHSYHGHEEGTYAFILKPKSKRPKITSMR